MGEDREFFGKDEMAAAFSLDRVSPNPARFDLKKCTAINGDWIRTLAPADLAARIVPYLVDAGVVTEPLSADQLAVLDAAVPLVQERMETLRQSVGMLAFLLLPRERFSVDETDAAAVLTADAQPVVAASIEALEALADWSAEPIEQALRGALIDGLGPEAEGRVRPGSRCGDRSTGVPAAVRVARDPRPGDHSGAAEGGSVGGCHRRGKASSILSQPVKIAEQSAALGYGVIGSPTDSGSVSLGSSPGTPATCGPA